MEPDEPGGLGLDGKRDRPLTRSANAREDDSADRRPFPRFAPGDAVPGGLDGEPPGKRLRVGTRDVDDASDLSRGPEIELNRRHRMQRIFRP